MKVRTRRRTACRRLVRSFDHSDLAALPAYPALRQALGDIACQVPDTALAAFAVAVSDMAVTAPFADLCGTCSDECARDHPPAPTAGRAGAATPAAGHTLRRATMTGSPAPTAAARATPGHVSIHLSGQRLGQHPPPALPHDPTDQRPQPLLAPLVADT